MGIYTLSNMVMEAARNLPMAIMDFGMFKCISPQINIIMMSQITLPIINSTRGNARELVVFVLSLEWPLSTKEIYNRLAREHSYEGTYQAAHKAITQAVTDGVLTREGHGYTLSKEWISQSHEFFASLKNSYSEDSGKYVIKSDFKSPIRLHFNDLSVFSVRMAEIFASNMLSGTGPKHGVGIIRHGWWTINFRFMDFALIAKMAKNMGEVYVMIKKNMPFDRWIREQYVRAGLTNTKIVGEIENVGDDILVQGDSIIQCKFSGETKELMDEIYEKTNGISGLFKGFIDQKLANQKLSIDVIITKNKELAELTRMQLMSLYEGKS